MFEDVFEKFKGEIKGCDTADDVENVKGEYFKKNGVIQQLMEKIKSIPKEEKPAFGKAVNELKQKIENHLQSIEESLKQKQLEHMMKNSTKIDLNEIELDNLGSLHPVTNVEMEIEEIFKSMGFTVVDATKEVVTEFENFEAVNVPKDHPARDMQDTFWLENGQLLKTQTSAMQNYCLTHLKTPIRAIFPGRCFRNEDVDACHEMSFFQMEGMIVDNKISIANLKYFMDELLQKIFKEKVNYRLRPGYFPFTEPSFEIDVECRICKGKGCPTCKNSGWLELIPGGMIHPNVLKLGGLDPNEYQGFAFGLGLTRLAMMKYGISDIRDLNSCNLKILKQFKD